MNINDLYNQYLEESKNLDSLIMVQDDFITHKINPQNITEFAENLKHEIHKSKKIIKNITNKLDNILYGKIYKLPDGKYLYIYKYNIEILEEFKDEPQNP